MSRTIWRCVVFTVALLALALPGRLRAQVTWPDDGEWLPVTRNGEPIADAVTDDMGDRNVVGSIDEPAAFVAADAMHLFFRLRVDLDPRRTLDPLDLRTTCWVAELDLDGDAIDYELLVLLRGADEEDVAVEVWANRVQQHAGRPYDAPEERLITYRPLEDYVRILEPDSAFNGTPDYFVDWSVPRAALLAAGWSHGAGAPATPTRWIFGTSRGDAWIDGDLATPAEPFTLYAGVSDAMLPDPSGFTSCTTAAHCGPTCEACPDAKPVCALGNVCEADGDGADIEGNRLAGGPINNCAAAGGDVGLLALLVVAAFLAWSRRRSWFVLALVLAPWGASAAELEAKAALERLHPTMFGDGIAVHGSDFSAENPLRLELLAHYERAPLVVVDADGDRLAEAISDRLTFDLVGAFGITDWLALGARLPFVLQDGDTDAFRLVGEPTASLEAFGVGDPEVALQARLLNPARSAVGLALLVAGSLPASGGASFIGESGGTVSPAVALTRAFGERAVLGLDLGFTAREDVPGDAAIDGGDELYASLGGVVRTGAGFDLIVEALGGTGSAEPFEADGTSLEFLGGVRGGLGSGFHGLLGGGAGVLDGYGVPEFRVLAGLGWRWADVEREPVEEPVEPLAEEGESEPAVVPEPARVAEPAPVVEPEPEPVLAPAPVVEPAAPPPALAVPHREELKERVLFASGRATLTTEARRQLDALVERIGAAAAARIAMSLEGHADPAGDADANRELSRARVETVRKYLAGKGAPAPVKSDWYGESVTGAAHEAPVAEDRRVDVIVVLEQ